MGLPGLRSLRGREKGLTQEKLSRELDVTMGTVWRWENGKADAPDAVKLWLRNRFECSFDDLMIAPPETQEEATVSHLDGHEMATEPAL